MVTCIQGEKNLNDPMSNQKANYNKQRLVYKTKNNPKKPSWLPHQFRKNNVDSQKKNEVDENTLGIMDQGIGGGKANRSYATYDNSKGTFNPSYVVCMLMGVLMLNLSVIVILCVIMLFGFLRPLLLTPKDP